MDGGSSPQRQTDGSNDCSHFDIFVPCDHHDRNRFESQLAAEREATLRYKGENGIMKKKFTVLTKDIEDQKVPAPHGRRNARFPRGTLVICSGGWGVSLSATLNSNLVEVTLTVLKRKVFCLHAPTFKPDMTPSTFTSAGENRRK